MAGPSPRWRGAPTRGSTSATRAGDHPRAGGEHGAPVRCVRRVRGPSPRWRGAPHRPLGRAQVQGTIPALAGSTGRSRSACDPRTGPSPRGRGALHEEPAASAGRGTIPAPAGSTGTSTFGWPVRRDHPRAGGEHRCPGGTAGATGGPSPRWRGAHGHPRSSVGGGGTIPALAGSTWSSSRPPPASWDHPRAGGEPTAVPSAIRGGRGPSPRWRGARRSDGPPPTAAGTIPARAGSTPPSRSGGRRSRDHPRAGGEHRSVMPVGTVSGGPSPRGRGAHRHAASPQGRAGTIPARAGSTTPARRAAARHRDHPRAGGEHARNARPPPPRPGPSPRWRGAPCLTLHVDAAARTIPALAGSARSGS